MVGCVHARSLVSLLMGCRASHCGERMLMDLFPPCCGAVCVCLIFCDIRIRFVCPELFAFPINHSILRARFMRGKCIVAHRRPLMQVIAWQLWQREWMRIIRALFKTVLVVLSEACSITREIAARISPDLYTVG